MIFESEFTYNPNAPYQFFHLIEPIEQAAIRFRVAHDSINHRRKYSNLPYWNHTEKVAELVMSVVDTEKDMGRNMVIAALGHDVLEDVAPVNPAFGIPWLVTHFPHSAVCMIIQLTDVFTKEKYPRLNRRQRKQLENERLSKTWPEVQTIKLADLIDNNADIALNDPNFAKTYLKEKNELLSLMVEGNEKLMQIAKTGVDNSINKL